MTSQVSNDETISVVCTSLIYTVLISAIFNLVRFMILHTYTFFSLVMGSPGLENAVKRWGWPIGLICSSVYFNASP